MPARPPENNSGKKTVFFRFLMVVDAVGGCASRP
jgi:hypothetical protein